MRRCDYITSHSGDIKIYSLKHIDEMLLCQYCDFTAIYSDNLKLNSHKHNGFLTRNFLGQYRLFYKGQYHARVYLPRAKGGMVIIETDATIISLAQYIVCIEQFSLCSNLHKTLLIF